MDTATIAEQHEESTYAGDSAIDAIWYFWEDSVTLYGYLSLSDEVDRMLKRGVTDDREEALDIVGDILIKSIPGQIKLTSFMGDCEVDYVGEEVLGISFTADYEGETIEGLEGKFLPATEVLAYWGRTL